MCHTVKSISSRSSSSNHSNTRAMTKLIRSLLHLMLMFCCAKIAVRRDNMVSLQLRPHFHHNRFASDYQTQFSIIKSVWVLFSHSFFTFQLSFSLNSTVHSDIVLCSFCFVCSLLFLSCNFFLLCFVSDLASIREMSIVSVLAKMNFASIEHVYSFTIHYVCQLMADGFMFCLLRCYLILCKSFRTCTMNERALCWCW